MHSTRIEWVLRCRYNYIKLLYFVFWS